MLHVSFACVQGFERGQRRVEKAGTHIEALGTDSTGMLNKYRRSELVVKNHYFDMRHLPKGILLLIP